MSKRLPSDPNLKHLKTQAKQLHKDYQAGQVEAILRIQTNFPPLTKASAPEILAADFSLCHAQLVLAREYGFATWKELLEVVQRPPVDEVHLTTPREFVGRSPAIRRVFDQLHQVAPTEFTVLIQGETGSGKGLTARCLHEWSQRKDKPFVQVNCAAIPEQLFESELFGHERGAFTGATSRRLGKVELAQGGTLFLDDIGDMPLMQQAKVLHLLEEHTFERIGGTQVLDADVRVVAATNRDLAQMVGAGAFREGLYFQLRGFEVRLPPLRQRPEDIPLLAHYFISRKADDLHKRVEGLSGAAEAALMTYEWPGNVRELQHTIERAVLVCDGPTVQVDDLTIDI